MVSGKQRHCFIVGPIGAEGSAARIHSDWLLEGIIFPVFQSSFSDFVVERADKMARPGMIDAQIIQCLLESELVIADMTFSNPNVFYEIGIRHVVGKPIIHMFLENTDIPFDVKLHRAIGFEVKKFQDIETAKKKLFATLTEVLDASFVVENPVSNVRGSLMFPKHATPGQELIDGRLQTLENKFEFLLRNADVKGSQDKKREDQSVIIKSKIRINDNVETPYLVSIYFVENSDDPEFDKRKNEVRTISKNFDVHEYISDGNITRSNISYFGDSGVSFEDVLAFADKVVAVVAGVRVINLA